MYVSVAVMDTGIFRHMDFDTRIAGFADFVGRKNIYTMIMVMVRMLQE